MPTEEQVLGYLETVLVPGVMRSLTEMNLVRSVAASDIRVDVVLSSAALPTEVQDRLKTAVENDLRKLEGVGDTSVTFAEGSPKDVNQVRHVVAVMSGKGGVGKSLVAGLAAVALRRQGATVGILDADITGPSIPRMFGITARPAGSETGILPVTSRSGIEVMSMNLLLDSESDAVIWRGPLIGSAITQFWEEVLWGKLDYLIIDLPPGTADAPLTVMQTLPVTGVVIVFTPQDLTAMIVKKAVHMVEKLGKPIVGVVENMSYLYVPEIDKMIELFGRSRAEEMAEAAGAPLLAEMGIDPQLAKLCDEGNVESYDSEVVNRLGQSLSQTVSRMTG